MMGLHGGQFDPDDAGIDRILDNFGRLVKKWEPKPRRSKTTSRPL